MEELQETLSKTSEVGMKVFVCTSRAQYDNSKYLAIQGKVVQYSLKKLRSTYLHSTMVYSFAYEILLYVVIAPLGPLHLRLIGSW